jgi:hypothetical protein
LDTIDILKKAKSPTHIGHKLKDIGQSLKDCNRKYILQILPIIVMLAIGGQAFHGHNKSDDTSNRGNFLNTLDLLWKSDAEFDEKFKALPDNAKYMGIMPLSMPCITTPWLHAQP